MYLHLTDYQGYIITKALKNLITNLKLRRKKATDIPSIIDYDDSINDIKQIIIDTDKRHILNTNEIKTIIKHCKHVSYFNLENNIDGDTVILNIITLVRELYPNINGDDTYYIDNNLNIKKEANNVVI